MSSAELPEPPQKRVKLSPQAQVTVVTEDSDMPSPTSIPRNILKDHAAHLTKEADVGITDYVSVDTAGFRGTLKKRYTDFLVNEVLPDGRVVHLQHLGLAAQGQPEGVSDRSELLQEKKVVTPPSTLDSSTVTGAKAGAGNLDQMKVRAIEDGTSPVAVDDITKLMTYFDDEIAEKLMALYNHILSNPSARPRDHGYVTATIPTEKSVRTSLHQDIRRIFGSRIESSTDKGRGTMTFSATDPINQRHPNQHDHRNNQTRQRGKLGWTERGGEYLHFSIYKENKDTMEVISHLARQLQINAKNFQFAGTKDRRAVTVQRASAYRVEANRLAHQNRMLRNSAVGDFKYQKHGLELGDLKGNEFVITLRECEWEHTHNLSQHEKLKLAAQDVSHVCRNLHTKGFFNYYGLQRFGTFSTRTDVVGLKLLQGDFQSACESILHYGSHVLRTAKVGDSNEQISSDDKARAEAIHMFQSGGKVNDALNKLPRKFSAEACIIRHLTRYKTDFAGAIQTIQRNLRLMYVHAYQSLVWNFAVGERWRLFGDQVVEGDLVLVKEHQAKEPDEANVAEEVDADGEVVVQATAENRAQAADDIFERARALTADEASSGNYSIMDVVLPLPGFDVLYPSNNMTDFYKDFMGRGRTGLDPFMMRRKQKDLSLSGSYRKIIARINGGYDVQVRAYQDDIEQFVETDMEKIKKQKQKSSFRNMTSMNDDNNNDKNDDNHLGQSTPAKPSLTLKEEAEQGGEGRQAGESDEQVSGNLKLAVIVKMQLGSSQYATMALRELSKSGIQAYKPDFSGGR